MSKMPRLFALVTMILSLVACRAIVATAEEPVAQNEAGEAVITGDVRLPGDTIRLAFWREPDLSGDFPIDENGNVVLPIIGSRKVTGIEAAELKRQLTEEYGRHLRDAGVQITLLQRVRILGEVKTPGVFQLDPTMSMGDAIALAGGLTDNAKNNDIKILRNGKETHNHLNSGVDVNRYVRSGDQIRVPKKNWFVRNGAQFVTTLIAAGAVLAL